MAKNQENKNSWFLACYGGIWSGGSDIVRVPRYLSNVVKYQTATDKDKE